MKKEEVTTFNSAEVMRGYTLDVPLGVCNTIQGLRLSEPDIILKEVLRLDKDGMTYKGVRIEDAGEAHRAWMESLSSRPLTEADRDAAAFKIYGRHWEHMDIGTREAFQEGWDAALLHRF